jgi:hypothetical protein
MTSFLRDVVYRAHLSFFNPGQKVRSIKMASSKIVLTTMGKGQPFVEVGDENLCSTRHISAEAFIKLCNAKGKAIQIRDAIESNHPQKFKARAAMVGSYDGKGKLSIAIGEVGMPITGNSDIVLRETYEVEPKLFEAFYTVFKATLQDEEAVKAIGKLARKSQVVEVAVTL